MTPHCGGDSDRPEGMTLSSDSWWPGNGVLQPLLFWIAQSTEQLECRAAPLRLDIRGSMSTQVALAVPVTLGWSLFSNGMNKIKSHMWPMVSQNSLWLTYDDSQWHQMIVVKIWRFSVVTRLCYMYEINTNGNYCISVIIADQTWDNSNDNCKFLQPMH